jgi:hypothetical protein
MPSSFVLFCFVVVQTEARGAHVFEVTEDKKNDFVPSCMFFISVILSFIYKNADCCLCICRPAHGNLDVIFNGGTRTAGIKAGMRKQVKHTAFWWGGILEVDVETADVVIDWKD